MENCRYHRKTICTYDLKDENGIYYEDLVLDWKQAAADRQLICIECGAPVYLAAGPIKEPYFAHYDLVECEYGNGHESEEHKVGKRLLYNLLRRSFPEADIQARYYMDNGMYSTVFCRLKDGTSFALDYRLSNNSLEKFRLRDSFYQANGIKPIYVMGIRQQKDTKQIDWYQSLLQTSMGYLIFLDTEEESLTLKKSFGYRLGNSRKFRHCMSTYKEKEVSLGEDGWMLCDFKKECEKIEKQIVEEKNSYQKTQEHLKKLQRERQEQIEKEAVKQEAYRLVREQANRQASNDSISKNVAEKTELDPVILEKCRRMIAEGNAHLVSKKYYEAIMGNGN